MPMDKDSNWLRWAAASVGATGVAAAAFGAHGLEKIASSEQVRWWAIGAALELVVAPALVALLALEGRVHRSCSMLLLIGVVVFSGSLYAMALGAPSFLGAVTPLGGLSMIAGWVMIAFPVNSLREKDDSAR